MSPGCGSQLFSAESTLHQSSGTGQTVLCHVFFHLFLQGFDKWSRPKEGVYICRSFEPQDILALMLQLSKLKLGWLAWVLSQCSSSI